MAEAEIIEELTLTTSNVVELFAACESIRISRSSSCSLPVQMHTTCFYFGAPRLVDSSLGHPRRVRSLSFLF